MFLSLPQFLIFFPKISVPFPSSTLDILPNSLSIMWKMILLSPFPFFYIIFFPTSIIFTSPPQSLKFSPNNLINFPPGGGGGKKLYIPLERFHASPGTLPIKCRLRSRQKWIFKTNGGQVYILYLRWRVKWEATFFIWSYMPRTGTVSCNHSRIVFGDISYWSVDMAYRDEDSLLDQI